MALNFYLNSISDSNKIHVETNATFTDKVGEFDVGTLTLEWNKTKNKIVPYTKLYIEETTNNDYWCFIVLNDDVSVVKKNKEVVYSHALTVTQNTNELSTHLVRNTIFSQPIAAKRANLRATGASGVVYDRDENTFTQLNEIYIAYGTIGDAYAYNYHFERVQVSHKEKVAKAYLEINLNSSAYQTGRYLPAHYVFGSPRSYQLNNYYDIYFVINKYSSRASTSVLASLDVHARNGQAHIDLNNSFFESGYWYEFKFDESQLPRLKSLGAVNFQDAEHSDPWPESATVPSIESLFDCSLVIETYYYSLLDVLKTLRHQYRQQYSGNFHKDSPYEIPVSGDVFDVLNSTIAPNLTFTEENLWTCVAETLKFIDAFPTIDKDNYLGFEYLNDYSRTPITIKRTDDKSSLSSEYYTNSLVANYQNAKQENAIYYPAKNVFRNATSKEYGIPGKNDYELTVDRPIDYIDKVLVLQRTTQAAYTSYFETAVDNTLFHKTGVYFSGRFPDNCIDITSVIFEKEIYSLLPMGSSTDIDPRQLNSLYYERNGTSIYLGGVRKDTDTLEYEVYKAAINLAIKNFNGLDGGSRGNVTPNSNVVPSTQHDVKYCIKFHAVYDGRVSQESPITKHEGETYATQEQGGTSLRRMGNNMQGLIARLGNEIESVTIPVTEYGSRIRKGTLWVDDDGKKYIANVVKTTFSTSSQKVIVEAQFSRNFNLLSQFTRINQEKRFYEINKQLISKGYDNLVEFLYFSTHSFPEGQLVSYTSDMLLGILKESFIISAFPRKHAFSTVTTYLYEGAGGYLQYHAYIPSHVYGFGNSICFECGYEHPLNITNKIISESNKLKCESAFYVGEDGFADIVDLQMWFTPLPGAYNIDEFPYFPNSYINTCGELFKVDYYRYFKKPNEILHINYSIAFLAYENEEIFFGDALINENSIIEKDVEINPDKNFYLYAGTELYSMMDNKVLDTHTNYGRVTVTYYRDNINANRHNGYLRFTLDSGSIEDEIKAWAIADANGNIYFAVNETLSDINQVQLYFFSRNKRI